MPTSRGSRWVPPPPGSKPELHLWLAKLRALHRDADGAGHRRLATAAQCKAVDRSYHRLAEVLDEIEHRLTVTAGSFGIDCAGLREVADVSAGDEGFVARTGQDDAAHGRVVLSILEGGPQLLPCRPVQGVQHLGPVDGHISDRATLLVENVREPQRRR